VIEQVRTLVTDDDLMERDNINAEIDGMMAVGVVWLQKLHQRHHDEVMSENHSGFNTAMISSSNTLNVVPKTRDMWIADSSASCHMTSSRIGMTNLIKNNSEIKIGNGKTIHSSDIGQKRLIVIQADGTTSNIILNECLYVPGLCTNLFSITKAIQNKWRLTNDGLKLKLTNGQYNILCDQVLKTTNGYVNGVYMCHHRADKANLMITADNKPKSVMDINDVHTTFGHINKDIIYKTGTHYNFKVKGALKPCIACSLTKIKQRNVPKSTENKSNIPGERLFLDISSSTKFWRIQILDIISRRLF
jgi:hypothetical protein